MPQPTNPAPRFPPNLLLRAQGAGLGLKAAIFDVDGVLTDGRIYIGEAGEAFKAFNTLDGQGLRLLQSAGVEPLIITGRDSLAVRRRVQELGLRHAVYGVHNKLAAAQALLAQLQLSWSEVAAMGDDWPDLPLLVRAALSSAPSNAHTDVKAVAHHLAANAGGHGAAREFCDLLLLGTGQYAALLQAQLTGPTTGPETSLQAPSRLVALISPAESAQASPSP
jgi:3-deoxy-D-manno-octulosonate 8-phosphate phosphatase (KDO 8-P phosphatase)